MIRIDHRLGFRRSGGGMLAVPGGGRLADWQAKGWDGDSLVDDPGSGNPEVDDCSLRTGFPALKLGCETIDASQIALLRKR